MLKNVLAVKLKCTNLLCHEIISTVYVFYIIIICFVVIAMALMHKSPKPYKSRCTTAILSFPNRARIRMKNFSINTLVV